MAQVAAVAPCCPRPDGRVIAVFVEIPTDAAAAVPDSALEPLLDLDVVGVLYLGPYLDGIDPVLVHDPQRVHDVVDLRFDHHHDRGVTETGIGTEDHEQVRESLHRRAP